jgi:hypothetical protein
VPADSHQCAQDNASTDLSTRKGELGRERGSSKPHTKLTSSALPRRDHMDLATATALISGLIDVIALSGQLTL